jgi:CheY-like chemotaxis protein
MLGRGEANVLAQGHTHLAGAFRILVVDDYPDTCESTAAFLKLRGHVAHTALTGQEAIRQISEFTPDLVLLDIGMPDMDGIEVAQTIRETKGIKQPVIAAMSGFTSLVHKRRCASIGFDYYLVKPVDPFSIDQLLWFEKNPTHEKLVALKQRQIEINHQFARSQMEYAGIMLDMVSAIRNDAIKKRCVENAQRIKEGVTAYLLSQTGLSPNELHVLRILLGKLDVGLTAAKHQPAYEP